MNTQIEDKVELTRFFRASRERLFDLWTNPDEIPNWFPAGPSSRATIDLRVGGRYAISFKRDDGEIWTAAGEYREIDRPTRLVYTWRWEDDADWDGVTSVVAIDFIEKPGGTEVRLTHEGFPTAESRQNHTGGWGAALEKMEEITAA